LKERMLISTLGAAMRWKPNSTQVAMQLAIAEGSLSPLWLVAFHNFTQLYFILN